MPQLNSLIRVGLNGVDQGAQGARRLHVIAVRELAPGAARRSHRGVVAVLRLVVLQQAGVGHHFRREVVVDPEDLVVQRPQLLLGVPEVVSAVARRVQRQAQRIRQAGTGSAWPAPAG